MSLLSLTGVLSYLRRLHPGTADEDAQLLVRFAAGDENALEALVRRHGPMVWSACRRMLPRDADAEDAFQATFLVLVRKARSLADGRPLAPWLYTVATRTAAKARARSMKRSARETGPVEVAVSSPDEAALREVRAVVDEEVGRLPGKYREAVVLCYLQGQTNEEAARHLGCPKGTVLSRLSRARDWLRRRLERRGLGLCAVGLGEMLAPSEVPVSAMTGAGRAGAASGAALALAEGVLTTMFLQQLKWVGVACLVLVLAASGAGWLAGAVGQEEKKDTFKQAEAAKKGAEKKPEEKKPEDKKQEKPPVGAEREERRETPDRVLARTIDFSGLDDPKTTLLEALEQLGKIYRISFDVNEAAFKQANLQEVHRTEVANPPLAAMKTSMEVVLKKILARLPAEARATYLIRKDRVEITTEAAVRTELGLPDTGDGPLLPLVYQYFLKKPLTEALNQLATDTGYSVVLDVRCQKQGTTDVTADFTNVPLDTALDVLADMAGLDVVRLANVFYVTTPQNAEKLRKKQAEVAKLKGLGGVKPPAGM